MVLLDSDAEAGARNERRLCAVCCAHSDTFEAMHGLLLWIMRALGVPCRLDGEGKFLSPIFLLPSAHVLLPLPRPLHLVCRLHRSHFCQL